MRANAPMNQSAFPLLLLLLSLYPFLHVQLSQIFRKSDMYMQRSQWLSSVFTSTQKAQLKGDKHAVHCKLQGHNFSFVILFPLPFQVATPTAVANISLTPHMPMATLRITPTLITQLSSRLPSWPYSLGSMDASLASNKLYVA
jgi:hypothetical protein